MATLGNDLLRPAESRNGRVTGAGSPLARRIKHRLKPLYANGQRAVARLLFAYSPDALHSTLQSLGITNGDSLLVHSGFRRVSGFRGSPRDVIDCLLDVIGADGNLLMLSIPYRGASERYARNDPLFDVVRTASAVGLISEVFRRREGVLRSLNPLHPVLACGPLARWLVADHEKCVFSCGKGSPFERFLSLDGKFLFFDAPYRSLTFMHYVEDCFRDRLPVPLYDPTPFMLRVKEPSGRELRVRQFVFSQAARARRNFAAIEAILRRERLLQTARVGNTRLLCVSARTVLDSARRLVEEGQGFYR
jgi:aminoglycoside 3-N-acetyltransferase